MPTFFDPNNLTDTQKLNWDSAVAKHTEFLNSVRSAHADAGGREYDFFFDMIYNPPGHPKSALFARLLEGKEILPKAPPRSYSYPDYRLVEEVGPHNVMPYIGNEIIINQCAYQLVSANKAAKALKSFLSRNPSPASGNDPNRRYRRRIGKFLEMGPVYIVEHNGYQFEMTYHYGSHTVASLSSHISQYRMCQNGFFFAGVSYENVSPQKTEKVSRYIEYRTGSFQLQNIELKSIDH